MRRKEFQETRPEILYTVLDRARYGHLATCHEGRPENRALNFVRIGERLYFHCAEGGSLWARCGQAACFATEDVVAWIPSTWRHPEMACPATTYYRSVVVHGTLDAVDSLDERAAALEHFMTRYQPEGGHRPIRADDDKYRGPLKALGVMSLTLNHAECKVKFGQHLRFGFRTLHVSEAGSSLMLLSGREKTEPPLIDAAFKGGCASAKSSLPRLCHSDGDVTAFRL